MKKLLFATILLLSIVTSFSYYLPHPKYFVNLTIATNPFYINDTQILSVVSSCKDFKIYDVQGNEYCFNCTYDSSYNNNNGRYVFLLCEDCTCKQGINIDSEEVLNLTFGESVNNDKAIEDNTLECNEDCKKGNVSAIDLEVEGIKKHNKVKEIKLNVTPVSTYASTVHCNGYEENYTYFSGDFYSNEINEVNIEFDDGYHNLTILCNDELGFTIEKEFANFLIDTVAPVITVNYTVNNKGIEVKFSICDDFAERIKYILMITNNKTEYSEDGFLDNCEEVERSINLEKGNYTLYIYARDLVKNFDEYLENFEIKSKEKEEEKKIEKKIYIVANDEVNLSENKILTVFVKPTYNVSNVNLTILGIPSGSYEILDYYPSLEANKDYTFRIKLNLSEGNYSLIFSLNGFAKQIKVNVFEKEEVVIGEKKKEAKVNFLPIIIIAIIVILIIAFLLYKK